MVPGRDGLPEDQARSNHLLPLSAPDVPDINIASIELDAAIGASWRVELIGADSATSAEHAMLICGESEILLWGGTTAGEAPRYRALRRALPALSDGFLI